MPSIPRYFLNILKCLRNTASCGLSVTESSPAPPYGFLIRRGLILCPGKYVCGSPELTGTCYYGCFLVIAVIINTIIIKYYE
jgi:hypothetical protein